MKKREDMNLPLPVTLKEAFGQCRRIVLVCFIICLAVRFGLAVHMANKPIVGDALVYDSVAVSMLDGHGCTFKGAPFSDKAPGYSVFLLGIYWVLGHKFIYVYLLQGLLAALSCGATVLLGYAVTRSKAVALLAGLAVALYPPPAMADTGLYNDSVFGFLSLGLTLLLGYAITSRKLWIWAVGGLILGLAIYVRPTPTAFPLIFLALALWRRWPMMKAVLAVAILTTCAGIVLFPWAMRNQRLFGVFTAMPSQSGRVLYCNWSAMHPVSSSLDSLPEDVKRQIGSKTAYERDRVLKRAAIEQIKARPGEYVASCFMTAARQWTNLFWPQPPSKYTLAFAAMNAVVLALAVPAFWRKRIEPLFRGYSLLYVLYITLVAALMSSAEPRYAFWTYPFVFILAADTVCGIGRQSKQADVPSA
jgi:hypothetical protein